MNLIKIIAFLLLLTVGCIAEESMFTVDGPQYTDAEIVLSDLPVNDCYPVTAGEWIIESDGVKSYNLLTYCLHPHEIIFRDKLKQLMRITDSQTKVDHMIWSAIVDNREIMNELIQRIEVLERGLDKVKQLD